MSVLCKQAIYKLSPVENNIPTNDEERITLGTLTNDVLATFVCCVFQNI